MKQKWITTGERMEKKEASAKRMIKTGEGENMRENIKESETETPCFQQW